MLKLYLFVFVWVFRLGDCSPCSDKSETPLECLARTGYLTPDYEYRLWDIASVNKDYLEPLWRYYTSDITTEEMRSSELDGVVNYLSFLSLGKDFYEILVANWTMIFKNSLESELLCFQKHFYAHDDEEGHSGINYWCSSHETKLPMKIYISKAIGNYTFNSLKIDYDVEGNIGAIEKPFIDEIRPLTGTNGLYLGKMYFRVFGDPIFVLWFALHRR